MNKLINQNPQNLQEFYDQTSMETGFMPQKYAILESVVAPKSTVLDLGCYDGRLGKFLKDKLDCTVDGVDVSKKNIQKATTLRNKYIFDLNSLNWPIKNKYDFVIFTDVIEHLVETDQFMINVSNLVRKNGHIIFSTPNIASLGRRLMLLLGKNPYIEVSKHQEINLFNAASVGHLRYFTLETMKKISEFYGFEVEKIIPTAFTPGYSNKLLEKLFPQFCWHLFVVAKKI